MHEMSIIQSLADSVIEHLPTGTRAEKVVVEVGSLEHLDADVMQFAWAGVARGPLLRDAELVVETIDVLVGCGICKREYSPANPTYLVCPNCQHARPEVIRGWGVMLRTIEASPRAGHGVAETSEAVG